MRKKPFPLQLDRRTMAAGAAVAVAVLIGATSAFVMRLSDRVGPVNANAAEAANAADPAQANIPPGGATVTGDTVQLTDAQTAAITVEPVGERTFPVENTSVGSIDFNEDMTVQVFAPYQGRIVSLFAELGDEITKGKPLFTIDSPDLVQVDSALIGAAGVLELTTKTLARAKQLYALQGIAQKDLEQAVSDQQAAEGALKAARDAVRIFGKTDAEIDRVVARRKVDSILVVPSPIAGRITARNAAPGLLVQPGVVPPPYSIADLSTMWMLANVAESDSPQFRLGQDVKVSVMAFPGRTFEGKVVKIGATVDPNTHRVTLRSEIRDPRHDLRPGMFATFTIRTGDPVRSPAVPVAGVIREGDGTMTVWVTTDRHGFVKRVVKLGQQIDGYHQILDGVQPGETIATKNAIFISNLLNGGLT
jgi:cobalt-zinc-cadmium efflux system membrane fusion protein